MHSAGAMAEFSWTKRIKLWCWTTFSIKNATLWMKQTGESKFSTNNNCSLSRTYNNSSSVTGENHKTPWWEVRIQNEWLAALILPLWHSTVRNFNQAPATSNQISSQINNKTSCFLSISKANYKWATVGLITDQTLSRWWLVSCKRIMSLITGAATRIMWMMTSVIGEWIIIRNWYNRDPKQLLR